MFRKSQAALEFLTTYAWAFLVILIMIGALAYFGILNPSSLLPDRCNFGSEIGCVDFRLTPTTMDLRLKNNIGEAIVIDSYSVSSEASTPFSCTDPGITGLGTGEVNDFPFTACNGAAIGFVTGEKGKVSITIDYHLAKSSTTYTHQVAGEVFATIT